MRVRTRILPVEVKTVTPEQIVGKGIVILFSLVGFIDFLTAGWLWRAL